MVLVGTNPMMSPISSAYAVSSQVTTAALRRDRPVDVRRESGFHGSSTQSFGAGSGKVVVIAIKTRGWSSSISSSGVRMMTGRGICEIHCGRGRWPRRFDRCGAYLPRPLPAPGLVGSIWSSYHCCAGRCLAASFSKSALVKPAAPDLIRLFAGSFGGHLVDGMRQLSVACFGKSKRNGHG